MDRHLGFSDKYKQCDYCGRPLPLDYADDCCPSCVENKLFHKVKEFIRSYDVNEYQVAAHFEIPVRQVKHWIRDGRIEYKQNTIGQNTISSLRCERCGSPVSFGTLCPKCLKLMNNNIHGYDTQKPSEDSRMRYLDNI